MKQILDGCTAATHIAYALSDVATIYPITPVASMGQTAQQWGMQGRKNYMGVPLRVEELESELGAAGATHGALAAGSLATTFTNSQGLMLMISNMFKMAGNMVPAVFHVGTRSLATHALSIFADHSDIMATRASGFAYLASNSVQETMDLALVAHLAAVEGSIPVCHFFDGWRTANQMTTIDVIEYEKIWPLLNWEKIHEFRQRALNPEHPTLRGSAQLPDVYFQNAEAVNTAYAAFPAIVQAKMDAVAAVTGRSYKLFEYVGDPEAEVVTVAMGSSCQVIEETIQVLNRQGYKAGMVKVRLFRPFSSEALLAAIPATAKTVVALDRTKENGAEGEPLFKDVATAIATSDRQGTRILGCRYGLSSKDFNPPMVKAIYDEAMREKPRRNFTVGITDDVTHLSVDVDYSFSIPAECLSEAVFYGFGSDGMVGATKQAARVISNAKDLYAQAYFQYSAKKSGGYTVSQLRFGEKPIRAEYEITTADYVACSKSTYVNRFRMAERLKEGGTFVLNCRWSDEELATRLPASMRRALAARKAKFYVIDAEKIAQEVGLGVRVNMIMETVFFKLSGMVPFDVAMEGLKKEITATYMHEGAEVVNLNLKAVDMAPEALRQVEIPADWATAPDPAATDNAACVGINVPIYGGYQNPDNQQQKLSSTRDFFNQISEPCLRLDGDALPVSAFSPDGRLPMGTTAFEKRTIAINIPKWDAEKCVECTECSFVCAHAAIRPYLLDSTEKAAAPADLVTKDIAEPAALKALKYRIQVLPEDCTGCSSCAIICPGHALTMVPIESLLPQEKPLYDYCENHVTIKDNLVPRFTINGSQFNQPLLQFSGACAGCGETPYVKLLTQLFGERMIIANATGCSSIWGANYPSNAYCARKSDGRGPAWGNSLFEDNAEYGYGMAVSMRQRRLALATAMDAASADASLPQELKELFAQWKLQQSDPDQSQAIGEKIVAAINALPADSLSDDLKAIVHNADVLGKKAIWAVGGDGWAYDIGFAGLDHVLASGEDINILVLDTECYSNTGGQTSKATPLGAVAQYSPAGKRTFKKDLGRMMMTYGTVYVASIALGANYQQAIDAMREAEAYPGPSIVIAYCPCIEHGIRAGMGDSIVEERKAVECGYWDIYRYNPLLKAQLLSPYIADSIAPQGTAPANGLPAAGSPSQVENQDMATAGEGPWDKVNAAVNPLTVDYPTASSAPQKPAGQAAVNTATSASASAAQPSNADILFPPDKLNSYLDGEDRYADIKLTAPQVAARLRSELSTRTRLLHTLLESLQPILK